MKERGGNWVIVGGEGNYDQNAQISKVNFLFPFPTSIHSLTCVRSSHLLNASSLSEFKVGC